MSVRFSKNYQITAHCGHVDTNLDSPRPATCEDVFTKIVCYLKMNNEEDFKWYIDLVSENSMTWDGFKKILIQSPEETWPNKSSLVLLIDELTTSRKELDELKNKVQSRGNLPTNGHQDKNDTPVRMKIVKTQ